MSGRRLIGEKEMSKRAVELLNEMENTDVFGIDTAEAARFIGCSAYTIRELAGKKEIPHYRIGTRILFTKPALIGWIQKQENRNWK